MLSVALSVGEGYNSKMPGRGILAHEGGVIIFGDIQPEQCWTFPLSADDGKTIEKLAMVHCLPSDQALDLYVFEARNNEELMVRPPYELFDERSRVQRTPFGEKKTHEVTMDNGGIVRFLLAHTVNFNSNSLS